MIPNNNLSVLPWYENINFQNHRLSYAYGNIYPLFTPDRRLLPFQIQRPLRSNALTVFLHDRNGTQIANITTQMYQTGLQVVPFAAFGYDIIVYPGLMPMNITTPEGLYYARITDGVQTWYSEMFTIVRDISGYLKIEWWDVDNLVFDAGQIVYKNPAFRNVLYLCTEIGKPEYTFEEDGETRDGYFFPEKQISEKTYKFTFLAPEFICDAIRLIRLSDHVNIYAKGQVYDCDTFLITPKWQTQGDIASVEAEFQCATVVKKIGRGVSIIGTGGDFNNDYNNDFNNN